ncbi:thiamine pyrophosphate-dependent dehydrogenase E1 component subunit alpha [Hyphomicrobiales bacterium]|jgi:TPP-dependent pyruvate/acetoin dehydrogenase alpha subunit|nr:thiamine pyrophosphate-dependent dehydrogenase E1 component subunit alpha [Rhodobiaceae bacterium]MDB4831875.1 thiamine pyrophosphate-dependent dehydrogenase E1 component subunit alpha [Hyphomicrobiales bacterium]MBT5640470.1 thiamine pyrophosphate-dependent dehydrogenase E1 component subunit alpha [Rhodobiaceae bacterium]MBT6223329.1 thiamine pyrophosphate-dependent dehydrogenase E1 component subunit alpha [Rhodobiaceae bacterium]MDC0139894.1 thiamine pyrophosphate-dependent dehydrogenase E|tara:strand:+ start:2016 stop:3017 length:1002 start_codon:yes stop_codon:yes gene_type:complete
MNVNKHNTLDNLSDEKLVELYKKMLLIRKCEEHLSSATKEGAFPGAVHLYIGQEAIAVSMCDHLTEDDWISSTHRGHGHFIAKGGDVNTMMAEIYGKATGICNGKGGSMHVADFKKGIMGANGVVGGGMGLAIGAALAASMDKKNKVSVVFFGDGAANQGVLMEAMNISSLWKLPLIFVCENNQYSEFTHTSEVTSGKIVDRAKPFGIPTLEVDGNNFIEMWQASAQAVLRARNNQGPTFIEAHTYRQRGHVEFEYSFLSRTYRDQDEVNKWLANDKDPLLRFEQYLFDNSIIDNQKTEALNNEIDSVVKESVSFAVNSPLPDLSSAFNNMIA